LKERRALLATIMKTCESEKFDLEKKAQSLVDEWTVLVIELHSLDVESENINLETGELRKFHKEIMLSFVI
jgi:hypothetical protein